MAASPRPARLNLPTAIAVATIGSLASLATAQTHSSAATGVDWPQWRGLDRDGVSSESAWSSTGKSEPLWTKELGFGHSSFAISDGCVYTLGYDFETKLDRVFCFDAETGEEIWRHKYPSEYWTEYHDGGTQTTPTVVGDVVYTSNREGKLFCLDAASGDVRWSHDLRDEFGLEPPTWGFSASPLVVDDRVFMNLGRVIAFDRSLGEQVWITDENHGIAYSTPAAFDLDGRSFLASFCGDGLAVIDRTNGKEIDFYPWAKNPHISPMTPVVIGDRIFISAGYDHGCAMVQFADGKLTELWSSRKMRNKMSGCVLYENHLYGFDESILKCLDFDGNEMWRKRGLGTGSMSIAGGRLLILDGKGQVVVAEANPAEYVELSRQRVLSGGTYWATPVLSHGRVYCRNSLGQMACLDYSSSGGAETDSIAEHTTSIQELPSAQTIFARHAEAAGGLEAGKRVKSIFMTGPGESLRNTVEKGVVELRWDAEKGFMWRNATDFRFGHNTDYGWLVGTGSQPLVLDGDGLGAIQEAGSFKRLFDFAPHYKSFQTTGTTVFDNRDCYAIEAVTPEGYTRSLYFEIESGLYAGMQGDGIHMWTLRDYREFEGVMLPTQWAFFEPLEGEMDSATFVDVTINGPIESSHFETPRIIRSLSRSPAEVATANKQLKIDHADLLGNWVSERAPAGAAPMVLDVSNGFLRIARPGNEPDKLSEPDENGRMVIIGIEYVAFTPQRNEDGDVIAIKITVDGESRGRLTRADDK